MVDLRLCSRCNCQEEEEDCNCCNGCKGEGPPCQGVQEASCNKTSPEAAEGCGEEQRWEQEGCIRRRAPRKYSVLFLCISRRLQRHDAQGCHRKAAITAGTSCGVVWWCQGLQGSCSEGACSPDKAVQAQRLCSVPYQCRRSRSSRKGACPGTGHGAAC